MILSDIQKQGLISPPYFLVDNTIYLTIMGSEAYGCCSNYSDKDLYGVTIPPKNQVFPHHEGRIFGFDFPQEPWREWQKHHVDYNTNRYDFKIYSLIHFFHLLRKSNPTILDSIFTSRECVMHSTEISEKIRQNRRLFLSKAAWPAYKGYAYSQLTKMKRERVESNRKKLVDEHGYDTKFAYHIARLLNEAEQIFTKGDLDLRENSRQLISIRNGEWSMEQFINYAESKEKDLESIYLKSTLPMNPPEDKVKELLVECLEMHYSKIPELHVDKYKMMIDKIGDIINAKI